MNGRTVWLASYPKSGSTWVRAVWTALITGADPDVNALHGGPMPSLRATFDATLGLASSDLTAEEIDGLRPVVDDALGAEHTEIRLRKVHDTFGPSPAGPAVVSAAAARSVLYVLRDPRAVAVSFAHHFHCAPERAVAEMGNPAMVLSGSDHHLSEHFRQRLGSWSDHVRSWVDQTVLPVHVLRYEDALNHPAATFSQAWQASGMALLDHQALAAAVGRATFDMLRDQEAQHGFRERATTASAFFRRGRADAWRQELDPALARRVEADHAEVMVRFGYLR